MKSILLSMVSIGVVGSVVLATTGAFFSDTETSSGNVLGAGSVDLLVNGRNNPVGIVQLDDLKPGDEHGVNKNVKVDDNSSRVWVMLTNLIDDQGLQTEPELKDEDEFGGSKSDIQTVVDFGLVVDGEEVVSVSNFSTVAEVSECWIPLGVIDGGIDVTVVQKFKMWSETGNWAQGDTLVFDEKFYAIQERHTDNDPPESDSGLIWNDTLRKCVLKNPPLVDLKRLNLTFEQESGNAIYENTLVYRRHEANVNLYKYNLATDTEIPLIVGSGNKSPSGLYNNSLLYEVNNFNGDDTETKIIDLNTLNSQFVAGGLGNQTAGAIWGDYYLYIEGYASGALYLVRISTGNKVKLSEHTSGPFGMWRNYVVWQEQMPGGNAVYGFDISKNQKFDIATSQRYRAYPSMFGYNVSWVDFGTGGIGEPNKVIVKNLRSGIERILYETRVTSVDSPVISDEYLVWGESSVQHVAGVQGVDLWGQHVFEIQEQGSHQNSRLTPGLWKNVTAWQAWRTGNGDMYRARMTPNLTDLSFNDDFTDGNIDGWTSAEPGLAYGFGNWSVVSGELSQNQPGDHYQLLVDGANLFSNTVETKLKLMGPAGYGGVTVWRHDIDNWVEVILYPAAGVNALRVLEVKNGVGSETVYPHGFSENVWYDLKVEASGNNGELIIFVDDVLLETHVTTSIYRSGRSGQSSGNSGGYFDDFSLGVN